jgi:hypothetical protein
MTRAVISTEIQTLAVHYITSNITKLNPVPLEWPITVAGRAV